MRKVICFSIFLVFVLSAPTTDCMKKKKKKIKRKTKKALPIKRKNHFPPIGNINTSPPLQIQRKQICNTKSSFQLPPINTMFVIQSIPPHRMGRYETPRYKKKKRRISSVTTPRNINPVLKTPITSQIQTEKTPRKNYSFKDVLKTYAYQKVKKKKKGKNRSLLDILAEEDEKEKEEEEEEYNKKEEFTLPPLKNLKEKKEFKRPPLIKKNTSGRSFTKLKSPRAKNLSDIDLAFKIHDEEQSIELKAAVIEFDVGEFTRFSNKVKQEKIPAFFMQRINSIAFPIVKKRGGIVLFTAGDNLVGVFPKTRYGSYTNPFHNAFYCSVELLYKLNQAFKIKKKRKRKRAIEKEKKTKRPNEFRIGIETGTIFLNINNEFKEFVPISGVGKAINLAQRCEAFAKIIRILRGENRPLVMSERLYNIIYDELKSTLLPRWHEKPTEKPFKELLISKQKNEFKQTPYVVSIHHNDIVAFYEKRKKEFRSKRTPRYSPLKDLIRLARKRWK